MLPEALPETFDVWIGNGVVKTRKGAFLREITGGEERHFGTDRRSVRAMSEWREEEHPRRSDGTFCTVEKSIRERAKEYSNIRNGLDGDSSYTPTDGFKRDKRDSHGADHAAFMGYKNTREYESAGNAFMSRSLTPYMEEILTKDGKRVRYSHRTNLYGIASRDGKLMTFYDVRQYEKEPAKYWEGKVRKYGARK